MGGGEHGHGHGHGLKHFPIIEHPIPEVHHGPSEFKIPDWRIYKVENAPELLKVKEKLAARGLKDPWLRNEVWRYDPQFGYKPKSVLLKTHWFGSFKWGFAAFVATVILKTGYDKVFAKKHDEHHAHH